MRRPRRALSLALLALATIAGACSAPTAPDRGAAPRPAADAAAPRTLLRPDSATSQNVPTTPPNATPPDTTDEGHPTQVPW